MSPRLATALMAAALVLGAGRGWALDAAEQLQFADGVYARGLWDVALSEYEVALALVTNTPAEASVLYRMGECRRALGQTNDAEVLYRRAAEVPGAGEYRFKAGLRRVELSEAEGRVGDALQLTDALVRSGPTGDLAAVCRYTLGNLQERSGLTNAACATYETLLTQHAGSAYVSLAALALANILTARDPVSARAASLYSLAATNAAGPRVGGEAWFQLGEILFRQRQYEASARAYEQLVTRYPGDERVADSRLQRAWASHHAGLYAAGLTACDDALKAGAGKHEAEWLYLKANCERQLARYDAALETYAALLQRHPGGDVAQAAGYERALVLFKTGRYTEAVQAGRPLTPGPRLEKDLYWLLAESGAAMGDDALAVQYYRLLVDKYPRAELAADAMYRLGHLMQKKGDLLPAAEWFVRLAGDFPTNALAAQALYAAGACRNKAGQADAAIRDWGRLIQAYPSSAFTEEALYRKGIGETALKRDEQATATWRELLKRYPSTRFAAEANFWSGVLAEERGRLDEAESAFRTALGAKPAADLEARARFRLALVLQRRNMPDESASLLQGLLAGGVTNAFTPELLEWLTDYRLQRKEYPAAVEVSALLAQRAGTEAWQQIAWCLHGKALAGAGRTEDARAAFEKTVTIGARSQAAADAWLRLGDLALQGQDAAGARRAYEKAAALSSADTLLALRVQAYAGLARALKAQGDLEGAARHFLSVGVLFDDASLVPECLHEAAAAYAALGRADDSAKIVKDLKSRYPDSPWAQRYK